jgi:hypothetical protein
VRGVGGAGGDERAHRAGLGDALLEDLTVVALLVVEQVVAVDGLVELAHRRVDADLPEERLHAEGAGLVGHDRHDQVLPRGSRRSLRRMLTNTMVVDTARPPCRRKNSSNPAASGAGTFSTRTRRCGTKPPSSLRRSSR